MTDGDIVLLNSMYPNAFIYLQPLTESAVLSSTGLAGGLVFFLLE